MKRYLNYIVIFVVLFVCFLLQTTLFSVLRIANMVPNLILVVTVSAGILYGKIEGMYAGVLCGLLVDLLYGSVIGIGILMFSLIGYGAGVASQLYDRDDYVVPLVAIAISDLAYGIIYYACNFLLRGRLHFLYYMRGVIIPEMIYTVLVGFFVFASMRRIYNKINPSVEVPLHPKKTLEG